MSASVFPSAVSLLEALRPLPLLSPDHLREAGALASGCPTARDLARELLRRGWLTAYQVNQLFAGRGPELVLGGYVLLERLGEGGMGQVFKARQLKLGRTVAVKLIRKERLDSADAVRRFHREIEATAQLSHPNIVLAYDADQAGDTHFLVVEYVEGTDLARLVKKQGPLPIALACDCVRQAALGLQHAFEKGLVHRDVKPANLLLTTGGTVKLLDLGLARIASAETLLEHSSTLTQEGSVMGTPDFIAPEQARDSHAADIRADLYSLGCTLYYLLSGRVPFPGGTLTEKLLKHQMDAPRPLRGLRGEVPPAVAAVVDRLMAKRPEERYQSPAEVAAALVAAQASRAAPGGQGAKVAQRVEAAEGPFAGLRTDAIAGPAGEAMAQRSRRRLLAVGGAVAVVVLALLALVIWRMSAGRSKGRAPEQADEKPTTQPGPKERLPHPQQVVAALRKLGGKVKVDRKRPGDPVTEIDLSKTAVTDADLASLKVFPFLEVLNLSDTQVSDTGLTHLKGLTNLSNVRLLRTKVTDAGLVTLKGLIALQVLDLHDTRVSDAGLLHLKGLANLRSLDLAVTQVSNEGMPHLKGLSKLVRLDLAGTKVSPEGLRHLKGISTLEVLGLTGPQVDDVGLAFLLREFPSLRSIWLTETSVSDAGLFHLKGRINLYTLYLKRNNVGDAGLAHLAGLTNLLDLSLTETKVSDVGLVHLKGLTKLQTLDLSYTKVSDEGLIHLEGLTQLDTLNLGRTKVTDAGIQRLQKALPNLTITR